MKQPEPLRPAPPTSEPVLHVGIILERDALTSFSCKSNDNVYTVSDSGSNKVEGLKTFKINCADNSIKLSSNEGELLFESSALPLHICSSKQQHVLAPHSGLTIDPVIAGRDFHWKKSIQATFPGDFEVHLDTNTNSLVLVNVVPFEEYLTCVFASEMGADCPPEFNKAQTVAARSWAVNFLKGKHDGPYSLCNDDDCQRYQGTTHLSSSAIDASQATRGEFVKDLKEQKVVAAYYSKSSGGHGEDAELAFGVKNTGIIPSFHAAADKSCSLDLRKEADFSKWLSEEGLEGLEIFCSPEVISESELPRYLGAVDEKDAYYRWNYSVSAEKVLHKLKTEFGVENASAITELKIGPRGFSGRILNAELEYQTPEGTSKKLLLDSEYAIRLALHDSFLYSSAFTFNAIKDSNGHIQTIDFTGAGWGHGVGFCQIGALGMALKGYSYKDILALYYPESEVSKGY